MQTSHNEVVVKLDIANMADGRRAGLCHFSASYSTVGIRQEGGVRQLVQDMNGQETTGPVLTGTSVWLKST